MAFDLRSSELENSFVKERINDVEKPINNICSKLSNYNKKLMLLKESGENLAISLQNLVLKESLNQSFKTAIFEFSDIITAVQNNRENQIKLIDEKVIQELMNFGPLCKKAKKELKQSYDAKTLDIKKHSQLQKLQTKTPVDEQKITIAEKEANLARKEASQAALDLSSRLCSFERKKLENTKHILLDFIKIEMMFYVKAVELYTSAYNTIKSVKVEEDLNEFMCHYKAFTAALDDKCLSSNESTIHSEDNHNDALKMQSTPVKPTTALSPYSSKTDLHKLIVQSACESKSNFDFGDQSL